MSRDNDEPVKSAHNVEAFGELHVPQIRPLPVDLEIEQPNEKGLLALMKAWRGGRATTNILAVLQDGYIMVFAVGILGAMIANLIIRVQHNISSCDSVSCTSSRAVLPWAICAGLIAASAALAHMFGPVLASAPEGFWLFDAPLRRAKILAKRLVGTIIVGSLVSALVGALVVLLTGSSWTAVLAWALACGLGTAAVISFAAAEQGAERTLPVQIIKVVGGLACVAAMTLVVGISAGWVTFVPTAALSMLVAYVVSAVSLLIILFSVLLAFGRLNSIRRARLLSGGALVSGMQGAAFALDFGLLRDILLERNMIKKGWVKPTIGRGSGAQALVWRDVQRLFRDPKPLIGVIAAAIVPYAVSSLGLAVLSPLLSGLVLCFLLVPMMNSLRVLTRTPGLVRLFPLSTGAIRTACMTVPAIVALLWAGAVFPAFLGVANTHAKLSPIIALEYAFITAVAGLMGGVRWVTGKQVNYNAPMLATGAGVMPPNVLLNLFRGFDMVAIITAPLIFGLSPIFSLAIALIVFIAMRGAFNMDELQAVREEQQRQAEAEKKKLAAKKTQKIQYRRK